jgi:hypothetical protein
MTDNAPSGAAVAAASPASDGPALAGACLDDPRVPQAMEEYLGLLQAGERPDRDAFLARYPDVAAAERDPRRHMKAHEKPRQHPPTAQLPLRVPWCAFVD